MVDTRPREVPKVGLPSAGKLDELVFRVCLVDRFGQEVDALGEKPDQAGEETLGPRRCDCRSQLPP